MTDPEDSRSWWLLSTSTIRLFVRGFLFVVRQHNEGEAWWWIKMRTNQNPIRHVLGHRAPLIRRNPVPRRSRQPITLFPHPRVTIDDIPPSRLLFAHHLFNDEIEHFPKCSLPFLFSSINIFPRISISVHLSSSFPQRSLEPDCLLPVYLSEKENLSSLNMPGNDSHESITWE